MPEPGPGNGDTGLTAVVRDVLEQLLPRIIAERGVAGDALEVGEQFPRGLVRLRDRDRVAHRRFRVGFESPDHAPQRFGERFGPCHPLLTGQLRPAECHLTERPQVGRE